MRSKRLMFLSGVPVPDKARPIKRTGEVALLYMEEAGHVVLLCRLPSVYLFPRATVFAVRRLALKRALKNNDMLHRLPDLHWQHRLIAVYLPEEGKEAAIQNILDQLNGPVKAWAPAAGFSRGAIEL